MNLYFRLLWLLFSPLVPAQLNSITRTKFRCWPADLDLNLHMNNGRFLTLMDLGRLDFMRCSGLLWPCLKRRWLPVLGATQMTFLRPIKLWQTFVIESEIEYWDDKWIVMRQRFTDNGRLLAVGRIRGIFRGPQGNVAPARLLELIGHSGDPPPLPAEVASWLATLDSQQNRSA
jgi:acyl-CoA thioesterase FadM